MDNVIPSLCAALEKYLSGDGASRFGHHLDLVAPEAWIVLETAYLVNSPLHGVLTGWRALVEVGKVDMTLEFMGTSTRKFLEFKLVDTSSWNANWNEVIADLRKPMGSGKPIADASICLMTRSLNVPPRHPAKQAEYVKKFDSVSKLQAGMDYTISVDQTDHLATRVLYAGDVHTACWSEPVADWMILAFAATQT